MTQSPIDYSRKWYVMIAVSLGVFLATIDGSIVNVALPTLVRELQTEFALVQWVVLAYLLTLTTLMLSVGRLADMIGKKPQRCPRRRRSIPWRLISWAMNGSKFLWNCRRHLGCGARSH